jgi:hypothetical protein
MEAHSQFRPRSVGGGGTQKGVACGKGYSVGILMSISVVVVAGGCAVAVRRRRAEATIGASILQYEGWIGAEKNVVLVELKVMRRRLLAVLAQQTSMRRRVCVASPFFGVR